MGDLFLLIILISYISIMLHCILSAIPIFCIIIMLLLLLLNHHNNNMASKGPLKELIMAPISVFKLPGAIHQTSRVSFKEWACGAAMGVENA